MRQKRRQKQQNKKRCGVDNRDKELLRMVTGPRISSSFFLSVQFGYCIPYAIYLAAVREKSAAMDFFFMGRFPFCKDFVIIRENYVHNEKKEWRRADASRIRI